MKLIVVDGQGGGMGKAIAAQMRKAFPKAEILALGTNLLNVTKIKVMNLVPAIFLPILLCRIM